MIARSIASHNAASAENPSQARPRAFIPFRIDPYYEALYRGDDPGILEPLVSLRLVAYLAQAMHVNAMIGLFERMETTHGLEPQKAAYAERIGHYSTNGVLKHLQQLEDGLNQTEPQADG